MLLAPLCSSSGESIVFVRYLVYVTLFRWPSGVQVWMEPVPSKPAHQTVICIVDIYQMLYWYNWFSWWWAQGCSKHVEIWNKHIWKKNCASSWLFTRMKTASCLDTTNLRYLWPVTVICDQWQFSVTNDSYLWPVTVICDQWQLSVTCDNYLWQVTVICDQWQLSVSSDSYLWQVTVICDQWQLSVTNDSYLCPVTIICDKWQLSVTSDSYLWPVTVICDKWQLSVTSDSSLLSTFSFHVSGPG
jgi:hypothetical protein